MKSYLLFLPVFKQGDDLNHSLSSTDSVAAGFKLQAEHYQAAAQICQKLANVAAEYKLEVNADCHHISIEGPEDVLNQLVEEDILDIEEWDEDE